MSDRRQQAHAYLDRLAGEQLSVVHNLLESMLSPLDRKLALAPVDDEPLSAEEAESIKQGIASLDRDGGVSMEEVLAGFGLTSDQFQKIVEEK